MITSITSKVIVVFHRAPQVDIELGADKVEPGQEVDIKIKTRPDSYVCVLGIDQAVTVLK